MTIAGIKTEININTLVAVVGFLATFAGIITLWNQIQYRQSDFDKWILGHDRLHESLAARLENLEKNDDKLLDITFRLGQIEKRTDEQDSRLGRITENYGNQFSDIRTQLGAIATQLALTNQTLQRIDASRPPKELSGR